MRNKENNIVFIIITLGNSGVGKSSIINRYVNQSFDEKSLSTIGLNFSFKEVTLKNKRKIQLKLIDTGGQEKYRAISKSYFRNSDVVLFVFSLNDEKSYNDMTEWIQLFKENHNGKEGIQNYLIGNKSDLERKVDQNIIAEFAKNNNLYYIETSAKENISIDELFEDIAEKLYEDYVKSGRENKAQNNIRIAKQKKRSKKCCLFTPDDMDIN